jgi:hypothetical protein
VSSLARRQFIMSGLVLTGGDLQRAEPRRID